MIHDMRTVVWFMAKGLFLGSTGQTGKYYVRCPWAHEHTGTTELSDTVLYAEPDREATFTCSHASCAGRDINQLDLGVEADIA